MEKNQYLKEIVIKQVMRRKSESPQVKNVQEWLMLHKRVTPALTYNIDIDGDYGVNTENAVRQFQEEKNLGVDGIVGQNTFRELVAPLKNAFTVITSTQTIRDLIVGYAKQHEKFHPYEIGGMNAGPWVRSYMDGVDGKKMLWCMGFVQTIMDQAYSTVNRDFTEAIPHSFSCDEVANKGKSSTGKYAGRYIKNSDARNNPEVIQPGDIFLRFDPKNINDWTHTGIILSITGTVMHTMEGNTNEQGSREGVMVRGLDRDLKDGNYDIYRTV